MPLCDAEDLEGVPECSQSVNVTPMNSLEVTPDNGSVLLFLDRLERFRFLGLLGSIKRLGRNFVRTKLIASRRLSSSRREGSPSEEMASAGILSNCSDQGRDTWHHPLASGLELDVGNSLLGNVQGDWVSGPKYMRLFAGIVAVYLTSVPLLISLMKRRKALELRKPLLLWNVGLAIYSLVCCVRLASGTFHSVRRDGFWSNTCAPKEERDVDPIWYFWLYTVPVSKAVEMGDTLFVVLRKRRLTFLQYYHHAMACIVASFALHNCDATYSYYATMNVGVHALMYLYYALKTVGVHIPLSYAMLLTSIQIFQFFVAIFLQACVCFHILSGYSCHLTLFSSITTFFMYGTFTVLFMNFYRCKYLGGKKLKTT
ncbi:unnamed protein product [Darwinula stevensoni]|uniref:Elongation of very long chain fatty acids protein n=1 Tax=Darwinula stevensoni TaxID=69355 RepID=A0A7R9FS42_9CRUS|nr:unnamed protein product [Darwinula stevensoni]CAG0902992.1 unnamed protein product [Darwinula stevensoni]